MCNITPLRNNGNAHRGGTITPFKHHNSRKRVSRRGEVDFNEGGMGSEQIFDGVSESLHVARSEYALVDYDSIILWKIGAFKH